MDERELTNNFCNLFEERLPILTSIYKGFAGQKVNVLREARVKFRDNLKNRLPFTQKLVEDKEKDVVETKYINLVPHLQRVALALDNLISKMEIKIETRVLFTQKAIDEIRHLMMAVGKEFTDLKDYCMTKNPILKEQVRADMEEIRKLIDEYEIIHQNRLITGVCMPQASYLYIDMTDSLKRMAKELSVFAEKI
jgi:Na+/phosphate symporter